MRNHPTFTQRFREQLIGLRQGCSIIVGTPGRVLDHLGRGTLNLQHIRYVVLDEAESVNLMTTLALVAAEPLTVLVRCPVEEFRVNVFPLNAKLDELMYPVVLGSTVQT